MNALGGIRLLDRIARIPPAFASVSSASSVTATAVAAISNLQWRFTHRGILVSQVSDHSPKSKSIAWSLHALLGAGSIKSHGPSPFVICPLLDFPWLGVWSCELDLDAVAFCLSSVCGGPIAAKVSAPGVDVTSGLPIHP